MDEEKKDDPRNPGYVTAELCAAYREAMRQEIKGLKQTIIVGLSISTTIISIIMAILQYLR